MAKRGQTGSIMELMDNLLIQINTIGTHTRETMAFEGESSSEKTDTQHSSFKERQESLTGSEINIAFVSVGGIGTISEVLDLLVNKVTAADDKKNEDSLFSSIFNETIQFINPFKDEGLAQKYFECFQSLKHLPFSDIKQLQLFFRKKFKKSIRKKGVDVDFEHLSDTPYISPDARSFIQGMHTACTSLKTASDEDFSLKCAQAFSPKI